MYDKLRVVDGPPGSTELGVFCGSSLPDPLLSSSNLLTLQFTSDGSVTRTGFRVRISASGGKLG